MSQCTDCTEFSYQWASSCMTWKGYKNKVKKMILSQWWLHIRFFQFSDEKQHVNAAWMMDWWKNVQFHQYKWSRGLSADNSIKQHVTTSEHINTTILLNTGRHFLRHSWSCCHTINHGYGSNFPATLTLRPLHPNSIKCLMNLWFAYVLLSLGCHSKHPDEKILFILFLDQMQIKQ